MKKLFTAAVLTIIIALSTNLYAETAIFPYRIDNPSTFFNRESGKEYARLLSVGALFRKDMDIQSPRDTEIDMKRLGLSGDKTLTGDDLIMFGKSRYLDYILAGSLSKAGKTYISKSILYSVREKRIVSRFSSRSKSLFRLAEKEIGEVFINNPDIKRSRNGVSLDLVFMLDLSYRINNDWERIKTAVTGLSSKLIDEYGISTRLSIFPYSSARSVGKTTPGIDSLLSLKKELSRLSPKGGAGKKNFVKSLARAVKQTRWRKGAEKHILIITNSDPGHSGFAEDYAFAASQRKIKIHSLTLGSIKGDENETVRRLSEITGGTHIQAAYSSSIYKPDGERVYLYFENGRLFKSSAYSESWREGIAKDLSGNRTLSSMGSPYDEIYYDEKKTDVDPYNMDKQYTLLTGNRTIKKTGTESNINEILNKIIAGRPNLTAAAKVLLTDGKLSVWVPVEDKEKLRFFRKKHTDKFSFSLGVSIRAAPDRLYGLLLVPEITGISSDYIPDMLRTGLEEIIKKRDIYSRKGFFTPPIWFLKLKVAEIRIVKGTKDIRDQ
jgi:hypothetical protein